MDREPPSPWLDSPAFDGVFFIGAALISGMVGAVVVALPGLLVPVIWAWVLLLEGPHLAATWQRTLFDPEYSDPPTTRLALAAGLSPLLFLGASLAGLPDAMELLVAVAAVWSIHHTVRQHHGMVAMYDARVHSPRWVRELDRWALQVGLWAVIIAGQLLVPLNRQIVGAPDFLVPIGWVAAAVAGLCVAALLGRIGWAVRQGVSPLPGIVALGPAIAFTVFVMFGMGSVEPVYASASTPEQRVLAMSLVGGVMHGLQYLGIVVLANRPRFAGRPGWVGWLGRHGWASYGCWVLLSVGYLGIDAARSAYPGAMWFAPSSATAELFMALYWGLFFHHYVLDSRIWKVSRDVALRRELALG